MKTINRCDCCGRSLCKREEKILNQIADDEPCYCKIAKRIYLLERLLRNKANKKIHGYMRPKS